MSNTTEPSPTSSPAASPATSVLQNATKMLHNATECYTPATPSPEPQPLVNPDQPSTSDPGASPACYSPAITSPLPACASDGTPNSISSYDDPTLPATPATSNIDHPLLHLTPIQRQALDYLHTGHSITSTARALGVHRITIHRWKTQHPRFVAELAHRAGLSQIDVSLKAQRAIDLAMNTLLKKLVSSPRDAQQIAMRLISSPRLARLAATSNTVSLRQALARLQQTRALDTSTDAPANPAVMDDLLAELDAPIPTDPPRSVRPKPEPPKKLPWAPPTPPSMRELYADRPIRPELLALFQHYGCTPEQVEIDARRPDIAPFDIHYYAELMRSSSGELSPHTAGALVREGNLPVGVKHPLHASVMARMIARGLLSRVAGHDTTGYTATADPDTEALILSHPTKPTITIPRNHLWRDAAVP